MYRKALVQAVAVVFVTALSVAAHAAERTLGWADLVPNAPPLADPLSDLSGELRSDLAYIVAVRLSPDTDLSNPADLVAQELKYAEDNLRDNGVDIEARLDQAMSLAAEVERRNSAVVDDLDGKRVRIPGYALPLEFSGQGVKEFLLVPFVGACIHVPPPPPNQIVLARVDTPFTIVDLYTPVWITGTLRIEKMSRRLSLVDGEDDIPVGYAIDAVSITPYDG